MQVVLQQQLMAWNRILATRHTLGQAGTGLASDGNGDQQIDAGDYIVWKSNFGQTAGSGSVSNASAAVPEPANLELLFLVAIITSVSGRHIALQWQKLVIA